MLIRDFADRAEECIRFAEQVTSRRDRVLFVEMARAWCGVREELPDFGRKLRRRRRRDAH